MENESTFRILDEFNLMSFDSVKFGKDTNNNNQIGFCTLNGTGLPQDKCYNA